MCAVHHATHHMLLDDMIPMFHQPRIGAHVFFFIPFDALGVKLSVKRLRELFDVCRDLGNATLATALRRYCELPTSRIL